MMRIYGNRLHVKTGAVIKRRIITNTIAAVLTLYLYISY
jgi:hypothetical protein